MKYIRYFRCKLEKEINNGVQIAHTWLSTSKAKRNKIIYIEGNDGFTYKWIIISVDYGASLVNPNPSEINGNNFRF